MSATTNGVTTNGVAANCNGSASGYKWHNKYPHLGTGPVPADVFISEEQFALERERIFKKVWLNIGRVERIPNTGDYFVQDLAVCNTSVIVVRGKDGEVNAFHNMCSHRGNKIAWDKGGTCQNFTCKFHGWSYGLDGKLKFAIQTIAPAVKLTGEVLVWMANSSLFQMKRVFLISRKRPWA